MVEFVKQSTTMRVTHTPEARMRGDDRQQAAMWSYVSLEQRVLQGRPLRPMRATVTINSRCVRIPATILLRRIADRLFRAQWPRRRMRAPRAGWQWRR